MLSDVDSGLGVGAPARAGWDVDCQAAEADGVVVEDGGLIAEGEDLVQVEALAGAIGGVARGRGLAEASVVAADPGGFR